MLKQENIYSEDALESAAFIVRKWKQQISPKQNNFLPPSSG
jgi:hypothetical protein